MGEATDTQAAAMHSRDTKIENGSSGSAPARDSPDDSTPPHHGAGQKRKRFEQPKQLQHGKRNKRKDLGRSEWSRDQPDRRARNAAEQAKRRDGGDDENSVLPAAFSRDEIAAEDRRPKKKVAVMIGYSGSGYKGMQINTTERTIEGDLFTAFVKAGAISKANADDPKKSSLVRCARTDKGVHAAGNMISLKLIVEDDNIVQKINDNLSPQIRVWGIQRTIGSFSCYQACDSRWYEYLIPTHSFLPPHPSSCLGKKLVELADEVGDREGYEQRQEEVRAFWDEVEEKHIKPVLEKLEERTKELVMKALYETEEAGPEGEQISGNEEAVKAAADIEQLVKVSNDTKPEDGAAQEATEPAAIIVQAPAADSNSVAKDEIQPVEDPTSHSVTPLLPSIPASSSIATDVVQKKALDAAIKSLRSVHIAAKKAYRISPARTARVSAALAQYIGTRNYHNYTIQKPFRDASAKRVIKSFVANPAPIVIGGTEWLSLKVHGQSFMMHQIRKMVGMAALVVRCGCPVTRIADTYEDAKIGIPKVPGLGLLLERPVFDSYNERQAEKFGKEKLDFGKYEKELEDFKQREIYERIFREEERDNSFHQFFTHVDNFKEPHFLFVSSKGIPATQNAGAGSGKGTGKFRQPKLDVESEDESADVNEGG
ncbi:tRNA pseudouridine synthase A [Cryomyces antarcticus]